MEITDIILATIAKATERLTDLGKLNFQMVVQF